jgi:hypothetical protein
MEEQVIRAILNSEMWTLNYRLPSRHRGLLTAYCFLPTAYRDAAWGRPLRASRTFLSSVSTNVA